MATHPNMNLIAPGRLARRVSAPSPAGLDLDRLRRELEVNVAGEVRFDAGSQGLYAQDASNYRYVPLGVVIPKSVDDVIATMAVCRELGAPVLSRAGATSLAGQTTNAAVVIDWSKYLNRILEIDLEAKVARVEPGLIRDDLVKAVQPHHLTYGPDPATHSHCCFGGMLGNNSCGVHAQMAGKAVDNTEAMDILLYDGTRMSIGWMDDH